MIRKKMLLFMKIAPFVKFNKPLIKWADKIFGSLFKQSSLYKVTMLLFITLIYKQLKWIA